MIKKIISLILCIIFISFWCPFDLQAHSIVMMWDPPKTETLNNNCKLKGQIITNPIVFTVQWRRKGSIQWSSAESSVPTYTITNLLSNTVYETRVGAHYIGGSVCCFSRIDRIKTLR